MPALCRLRRHAPKTSHHPVLPRVGASALADRHSSTAAVGTPRKSMNTRVTTSWVGETRIGAACSYDSCERNAQRDILVLQQIWQPVSEGVPSAVVSNSVRFSDMRLDTHVMKEVRASA